MIQKIKLITHQTKQTNIKQQQQQQKKKKKVDSDFFFFFVFVPNYL
jgi:hypothetical protein